MNDAAQIWTRSKEELVRTVVSLGFPEEYFIAHPLIELDGVPRVVVHTDTNFLKETDDRNG